MVTENAPAAAATAAPKPNNESLTCYFKGGYVRLGDARISIMTHAFLYGTGVFEGIRAYWNADEKQLYALRVKEHIVRLRNSSKIMLMSELPSVDEFTEIVLEVLRRNHFQRRRVLPALRLQEHRGHRRQAPRPDPRLLRPVGPDGRLHRHSRRASTTCTVSWRRTSDLSMPVAQQDHRQLRQPGLLQDRGRCSTASRKRSCSPPTATSPRARPRTCSWSATACSSRRRSPTTSSKASPGPASSRSPPILGIPVKERQIDRSELYIADEVFLCGTGAQVSPVGSVDHRPVGDGQIGPITRQISKTYFDAVRGRLPEFRHWVHAGLQG